MPKYEPSFVVLGTPSLSLAKRDWVNFHSFITFLSDLAAACKSWLVKSDEICVVHWAVQNIKNWLPVVLYIVQDRRILVTTKFDTGDNIHCCCELLWILIDVGRVSIFPGRKYGRLGVGVLCFILVFSNLMHFHLINNTFPERLRDGYKYIGCSLFLNYIFFPELYAYLSNYPPQFGEFFGTLWHRVGGATAA